MQPVRMARRLPDILRIEWPAAAAAPPAATDAALDRAAEVLRDGGLVAIPTETVYGLAADALSAEAVEGIYRAKGRPASNPVIVHVADVEMARALAARWPPVADAIASRLWPGPVTVVVPRSHRVPDVVTAGGPTVALRCPDHRLARRLIERTGRPLAAPSANRAEAVSPTTAQHVLEGLGSRIGLILDAGPCGRGLESTVVDCTVDPPRILRPGPVSRDSLAAAVGCPVAWAAAEAGHGVARSPGQARRHYAPRTPLEIAADAAARGSELVAGGDRIGLITIRVDDRVRALAATKSVVAVPMPPDPEAYGRQLYATLHALDQRQLDRIIVEAPPETEAWRAVLDRLARAAE